MTGRTRILVLGGSGMLGHQLLAELEARHEVRVTLRRRVADYAAYGRFSNANAYGLIDLRTDRALESVLADFHPHVVVNAAGVIKQRLEGADAIEAIETNALFPHRLRALASPIGARIIHFSTDCVFSGRVGGYTEESSEDATDLYGRAKLLGELPAPALTLRTSIVGTELTRKLGLVEWYLSQKGTIRGFTRAIFSGVTTREAARLIGRIIDHHPDLAGLYHVASEPISKFEFLSRLTEALGRTDISIEPYDGYSCDRSLDASRLRSSIGYRPPPWTEMIGELAGEISGRTESNAR